MVFGTPKRTKNEEEEEKEEKGAGHGKVLIHGGWNKECVDFIKYVKLVKVS